MPRQRTFLAAALLVALVLAGVISGFASSSPDGLEKVAEDKGFIGTAQDHDLGDSPLADYGVTGVENARVSGGLAGVFGVTLTLAVGGGLFLALRRRSPSAGSAAPAGAAGAGPSPGTVPGHD